MTAAAIFPYPDESAASFAFRLARRDGLSLQEFCQIRLGLTHAQARRDLDQLLPCAHATDLAKIAGIPEKSIRMLAIPHPWILSSWDAHKSRHQAPVQLCPTCLHDSFYGRRFWRTRFAITCPLHGTEMVCSCPHCQTPVSYFSASEYLLVSHWLESFPSCPYCLKRIDHCQPAHPITVAITQYWALAFAGQSVRGLSATDFLKLSIKCLNRFHSEPDYQAAVRHMRLPTPYAEQNAAALLLHAMLNGPLPTAVFYAAIGSRFQPASLASELSTVWHTNFQSISIPRDRANWNS